MKKFFSLAAITLLAITAVSINTSHVSAETIDGLKEKVNELEKQQDDLKQKQGNVNKDKESTDNKLDKNMNKQDTVESEINGIDEKLSTTKNDIQTKENQISDTNQRIEKLGEKMKKLKEEIVFLKERIKKRDALLKDRLRAIQQSGGNMKFIEVILDSQSFGDFISRSSAVNTIMDQDKTIMEAQVADKITLEENKAEVKNKKTEVEEKKVALEGQKKELVALKSQLDNQMAKRQTLMVQLEDEHENLEDYKMSLEEEQKVLSDQEAAVSIAMKEYNEQKGELEQLAKEKAAKEQARAEKEQATTQKSASPGTTSTASVTPSNSNGIFSWPANGRLSSGFGNRSLGNHLGIDVANGAGTPITAGASGTVTRASFSSSYGNVVYIYHPQFNKSTVYAHMSSLSVSLGQQVSEGQQIGGMGNTGHSYGNHVHFEVHNGMWSHKGGINPMPYLK